MDERELIKKRLFELNRTAQEHCYFTFTDFLGLAEQTVLREVIATVHPSVTLYGGAEGSERVMARFGNTEELGYDAPFPIALLKIAPKSPKYADKLTHRDFLGAVLNLGIERDTLGDIVIRDKVGYLFCKEDIAPYIMESLERIKHTDVTVSVAGELPEGELYRTEVRRIQIASERLDAVIARVFSLSREDAQLLFRRSLVFRDGALVESTSYTPRSGERISVRGHGRFIYLGTVGATKKGRLNAEVELFI